MGTAALVAGIVALSTVTEDGLRGSARVGVSLATAAPSETKAATPLTRKRKLPPLKVQPGDVIRPQLGPVLVKASTGRVGIGTRSRSAHRAWRRR